VFKWLTNKVVSQYIFFVQINFIVLISQVPVSKNTWDTQPVKK